MIQKGHAVLWGIGASGAVAVEGYGSILVDNAKATHKFKLASVENEAGIDLALIATNEMIEVDIVFVPENSATPDFKEPFATIALSGFAAGELNGEWLYVGDASVDLSHKAGKITLKGRRYIGNPNLS